MQNSPRLLILVCLMVFLANEAENFAEDGRAGANAKEEIESTLRQLEAGIKSDDQRKVLDVLEKLEKLLRFATLEGGLKREVILLLQHVYQAASPLPATPRELDKLPGLASVKGVAYAVKGQALAMIVMIDPEGTGRQILEDALKSDNEVVRKAAEHFHDSFYPKSFQLFMDFDPIKRKQVLDIITYLMDAPHPLRKATIRQLPEAVKHFEEEFKEKIVNLLIEQYWREEEYSWRHTIVRSISSFGRQGVDVKQFLQKVAANEKEKAPIREMAKDALRM